MPLAPTTLELVCDVHIRPATNDAPFEECRDITFGLLEASVHARYDEGVAAKQLREQWSRRGLLLAALRAHAAGRTTVTLDYAITPEPRYGYGKDPHSGLYSLIEAGREGYGAHLQDMLQWTEELASVSYDDSDSRHPTWNNGFLPGLDAIALYSFLRLNDPALFLEIGSGTSTKFARKAIDEGRLRTQITSIDPHPRAEIDDLCDRVLRCRLESADLSIFQELRRGDIVFLDGSHRVLVNSDVTVFWLEVLPRLPPGVLVQVHDIYLPYDYPPEWMSWWYSEQYLLATQLLFGPDSLEIVLPNTFISRDPDLSVLMNPIWGEPGLDKVQRHGGSFWFRTRSTHAT
jgi:hypothetical protein